MLNIISGVYYMVTASVCILYEGYTVFVYIYIYVKANSADCISMYT